MADRRVNTCIATAAILEFQADDHKQQKKVMETSVLVAAILESMYIIALYFYCSPKISIIMLHSAHYTAQ